jgi:glyoxylase-like metal-dependent hydrolase (beta-lactamase superfamily II)
MTQMTRRTLFATAAAAGAVTALGPLAVTQARADMAKQTPGIYRYKLGSLECAQVTDGIAQFPMPDGFIKGASKEEINKALAAAYLPPDKMTVLFNPMVINTGSRLIVIDTGYGPEVFAQTKGARGQFMTNFLAAGYDPKAVSTVIISHLHVDHISGLKAADGSTAFPNAEILVPAQDWAFWMNDDNMKKAAGNKMMEGFFDATRKVIPSLKNQIKQYEWGKEIAAGITAIATPGHTPGHTSFAVTSGNAKMLVQSDVTNLPALFLDHPGWHVVWDQDGDQAEKTRRKFYDMASAEKMLIAGFHFPFPSLGYVEKAGNNYRLVPVVWTPTL